MQLHLENCEGEEGGRGKGERESVEGEGRRRRRRAMRSEEGEREKRERRSGGRRERRSGTERVRREGGRIFPGFVRYIPLTFICFRIPLYAFIYLQIPPKAPQKTHKWS